MISVRNLTKKYSIDKKERYILKNVSFELGKGEIGIILGRSGAGKSTLLHLIAGLDTPETGECWIGNKCITNLDEEGRAQKRLTSIGFVFQTFIFTDLET